jgi:hypothetical protein
VFECDQVSVIGQINVKTINSDKDRERMAWKYSKYRPFSPPRCAVGAFPEEKARGTARWSSVPRLQSMAGKREGFVLQHVNLLLGGQV